jgi:hypothetical protein
MARCRSTAAVVLAIYIAGVGILVALPSPVDQSFRPLIYRWLWRAHRKGLPSWFAYGQVEWLANVAMFVPIGFLVVAIAGYRRWWLGPAVGLVLSAAAEGAQLLLLPARFATIADILANGLGAFLGASACAVLLRTTSRKRSH